MLDGDDCPRQVHAGVGFFLNTQSTVGVIKKCHLGYFIVDDGDILGRLLADHIMLWSFPFNYGIIPAFAKGDLDAAVPIGHKSTDGIAVRTNDFETSTTNRDFRPRFILDDPQPGIVFLYRLVGVVAESGEVHFRGRVRIDYIILEFTVFILLLANCIKYGVFIDMCTERELDAAGFSFNAL